MQQNKSVITSFALPFALSLILNGVSFTIASAGENASAAQPHAGQSDCLTAEHALQDRIAEYQVEAGHSKNGGTESAYKKIRNILFSSAAAQDPACRYALLMTYALKSIEVNAYATTDNVRDSYNRRGSVMTDPEVHHQLAAIVRTLGQQRKIEFLTDDFRQTQKGPWLNRDSSGGYELLGGYDCASSTIYIDPYLRPLDFAVTLYHELDHLVRDKLSTEPNPSFVRNAKIDWARYNFSDELTAIGYSAGLQADLKDGDPSLFGSKPFSIKDDFTLISQNGPLENFIREAKKSLKEDTAPSVLIQRLVTNASSFESPQAGVEGVNASRVLSGIWEAYFPSTPMPADIAHGFGITGEFPTLKENISFWKYSGADKFIALLGTQSNTCKKYVEYLESGEVNQYLGTQYSLVGSARSATKASVRACLHMRTL